MQDAPILVPEPPMAEQRIEVYMLQRIEADQKALAVRVDGIDDGLKTLNREVGEVKGSIKPPAETPWWITHVVAPLCVTAILATAGAVIHLEIVVNGIGKNVSGVQGSIARQSLTTYAALPQSEFKAALPDLNSSIALARKQNVRIPPRVVDDLSKQLNATETSTADFWPTAAEFISYRSQLLTEWRAADLPPCLTGRPGQSGKFTASIKQGSKELTHGPVEYNNCKIVLDSQAATAELSMDLSFADVLCNHCVVIYNGGQIVIMPMKIATETPAQLVGKLIFEDCLFVLSFPTVPTQQGQQLTRTLLAASSNTVSIQLHQG